MVCAVSRSRTSGLRAPGTAPAKWGGAVGASKEPHKVARISVADAPADLLHRQIRLYEQPACLRHTALGDPLLHRTSRLASNNRGEVTRRQAHSPRHILERDAFAVALLDKSEDLGEQGFIVKPELSHDVYR